MSIALTEYLHVLLQFFVQLLHNSGYGVSYLIFNSFMSFSCMPKWLIARYKSYESYTWLSILFFSTWVLLDLSNIYTLGQPYQFFVRSDICWRLHFRIGDIIQKPLEWDHISYGEFCARKRYLDRIILLKPKNISISALISSSWFTSDSK